MDRFYRPMLLVTVALAAALLAREATLRQQSRLETAARNLDEEAAPLYPPRLLELPEGVVPVALNFSPPPLAPLDAAERQMATSHAARLNAPASDAPRLPAVRPSPFGPPPLPEAPEFPPARVEEAEPIPPAPANDAWIPPPARNTWVAPLPEAKSEEAAAGPALAPAQSNEPSGERSIIKRVQPISETLPDDVPAPPVVTAPAITAPPAVAAHPAAPTQSDELQAVDNRARRMVDHAFSVAQRGATYTARTELIQALQLLAQSLDAEQGTQAHMESLAAALRALEEGEDFQTQGARPDLTPNVKSLVGGHRTPVLKNADLTRLTALGAMQQYYTYAQEQFAAAADHRPSASLALYGLGKLHMAMAEKPSDGAAMDLPKAMVYHQAAMLVDPQNHLAANELGVLLARYEQWQEAKRVFLHSLAVIPLPQTWHNLAVVHQRLGEAELATQARFELEQLARRNPAATLPPSSLNVQWLTPAEFAGTSERPIPDAAGVQQPPLQTSQENQPGGIELWKPWTWF